MCICSYASHSEGYGFFSYYYSFPIFPKQSSKSVANYLKSGEIRVLSCLVSVSNSVCGYSFVKKNHKRWEKVLFS